MGSTSFAYTEIQSYSVTRLYTVKDGKHELLATYYHHDNLPTHSELCRYLWGCVVVSIPVKYIGTQYWPAGMPYQPLPLYNLLVAIPGHPVGSTVSLQTLNKEGYQPVESEAVL